MPRLSVILATDSFAQIERYVRELAADPVAPEVELVLVGPAAAPIQVPGDVRAALGSVQVLEREHHRVIHRSRLAGARAATSPVLLLAETHAWPAPGTVALLAEAIERGAAVAGPLMQNANPGTRRSWASFLLDYGRWWEGIEPAEDPATAPGHSCAWRRSLVLDRGEVDPEALRIPFLLAERFGREGGRIVLEPRARTAHLNADRPRSFILERLSSGRFLGAERSRGWSGPRRLLYACGSPLIPPLRLWRTARMARTTPEGRRVLRRCWPLVAVAVVVYAAGELLGYLTATSFDELEYELELAKERHAIPARAG